MDRRGMLATVGLSVASALSLLGCSDGSKGPTVSLSATGPAPDPQSTPSPSATPSATPTPTPPATPAKPFAAPTGITRVAIPHGVITALPPQGEIGRGDLIALTLDDGTNAQVIEAYGELARRTGIRLTFFANGVNAGWTDHAALIRPHLEDGTAVISNHTWSHPSLTKISSAEVADQVARNETFLTNTYGTPGRPFMRPPYGHHNATVRRQLADLGYSTIVMWYGSLSDSGPLPPEQIMANAREWFRPNSIVIGHLNHAPVIEVMDQIVALLQERTLTPVHLGDIYGT